MGSGKVCQLQRGVHESVVISVVLPPNPLFFDLEPANRFHARSRGCLRGSGLRADARGKVKRQVLSMNKH